MRSEKTEKAGNIINRLTKPDNNWVKPVKPELKICGCGNKFGSVFVEPVIWVGRVISGTGRWIDFGKCPVCLKKEETEKQRELEKMRIESEKQNYQLRIKRSGFYPKHLKMTFDNLVGKEDIAIKSCKQFCQTQDFNLFLWGGSGIKKTHLLSAIANELLKTKEIKFWRMPDFLNDIRKILTDYGSAEASDFLREKIESDIPILIDDIGAEKITETVLEITYNFFDMCELYERKGIVLTSNLPLDKLGERLTDRVASRISGLCKIIKITGDDWRLKR